VDALLCTALALAWDSQQAPYEVFTLVNQAVEAAKHDPHCRAQAGFVNACLRRFLRERDALVAATDATRWRAGIIRAGGSTACKPTTPQWQAILQASNCPRPDTAGQ
jgi:16S rRNA (cytosine967-C5)-methyltransferase